MNTLIRKTSRLLTLALALLMLAACGGTKSIVSNNSVASAQDAQMAYKKQVVANQQTAETLTARLGVNVNMGGKSVSCNGILRMKRDDVVQLCLTLPLLGTEVARLECTPTEVLLLDRFNKQFIRGTYSDVKFLQQTGLDFYSFQSMLWDELFVPGERNIDDALPRFRTAQNGQHTSLILSDTPRLEYSFLTLTSKAVVDRVSIRSKNVGEKGELICSYSDFQDLSGKPFPSTIKLEMRDLGTNMTLKLNLSRIGHDNKWETRTSVPEKYRERQTKDIFSQLSKFSL